MLVGGAIIYNLLELDGRNYSEKVSADIKQMKELQNIEIVKKREEFFQNKVD